MRTAAVRARRFVGAIAVASVLVSLATAVDGADAAGSPPSPNARAGTVSPRLTDRDPLASPNARAVYAHLVAAENAARSGRRPMTAMGQHIEGQNELYNAGYAVPGRTTYVGYHYDRVRDITGRLPAFVETDLGPGYDYGSAAQGWGRGNERWYNTSWGPCQPHWQYADAATDLLVGVWKGYPRPPDGTYGHSDQTNCDGSTTRLPGNGGSAAGLVGMSFHQPYPGSPQKNFDRVLRNNTPAASDPGWFDRVIDWRADTAEYRALLHDLSYLADNLGYLARYDIPVLLRPYHEMNSGAFWWGAQDPAKYQALWRIMYGYLVHTRGLHNLIFVWSPLSWHPRGSDVPWNYYPGAQYVDVVGVDDYDETPDRTVDGRPFTHAYYVGLADYGKPRVLAESYHVPRRAHGRSALTDSPWVIWTVWGNGLTRHNTDDDIKATYRATNEVHTGGSGAGYGQNFDWGSVHAQ